MLGILKKIIKLTLNLNTIQIKQPQRMIEIDKRFNETFRFGGKQNVLTFSSGNPNGKFIVTYRKFQANADNVLGVYYRWQLTRIERQTGIHIENNSNIGKG